MLKINRDKIKLRQILIGLSSCPNLEKLLFSLNTGINIFLYTRDDGMFQIVNLVENETFHLNENNLKIIRSIGETIKELELKPRLYNNFTTLCRELLNSNYEFKGEIQELLEKSKKERKILSGSIKKCKDFFIEFSHRCVLLFKVFEEIIEIDKGKNSIYQWNQVINSSDCEGIRNYDENPIQFKKIQTLQDIVTNFKLLKIAYKSIINTMDGISNTIKGQNFIKREIHLVRDLTNSSDVIFGFLNNSNNYSFFEEIISLLDFDINIRKQDGKQSILRAIKNEIYISGKGEKFHKMILNGSYFINGEKLKKDWKSHLNKTNSRYLFDF